MSLIPMDRRGLLQGYSFHFYYVCGTSSTGGGYTLNMSRNTHSYSKTDEWMLLKLTVKKCGDCVNYIWRAHYRIVFLTVVNTVMCIWLASDVGNPMTNSLTVTASKRPFFFIQLGTWRVAEQPGERYVEHVAYPDSKSSPPSSPYKNSVWVRERNIPTERPPLVGEVSANFCTA
jgi:hypothetical protein